MRKFSWIIDLEIDFDDISLAWQIIEELTQKKKKIPSNIISGKEIESQRWDQSKEQGLMG